MPSFPDKSIRPCSCSKSAIWRRISHSISRFLLDNVVQHNHWNGKDCPKTIRATPRAWEAFLGLCRGEAANVSKLDTDVDTLVEAGIIDQPDYWKAGNYSKDTVEALIGKTADYVREDE